MFRQCFDRLEMSHDRSHVHAKICLAGQFTSIFIETRWFQQSRIYDSNSLFHAHLKLRLELRQGLEGGVPGPAFPLLYSPLFFLIAFPNSSFVSKKTTRRYGSVHMCVVVSLVCEDFVFSFLRSVTAAMMLIVTGWLKWVKKETWSQSGRCLVCK